MVRNLGGEAAIRRTDQVPEKAEKRLKKVELGLILLVFSRFLDVIFCEDLLMIKELSALCTKCSAPFFVFRPKWGP